MGKAAKKGRRRAPDHRRRRTFPTIMSTRISVFTAPDGQVNVERDIELVKAAILYGDSVTLFSPVATVLAEMQSLARDESSFLELTGHMLQSASASGRSEAPFKEVAANWGWIQRLLQDPQTQIPALVEIKEKFEMARLEAQAAWAQMAEDSGVEHLQDAVRRGRLRFGRMADDADFLDEWMELLKAHLQSPGDLVLLDENVSGLARAMIREGQVTPPLRAAANAQEVAVGAGLLARLPAFPGASLAEVHEIRDELEDPLTRYRGRVSELRAHLLEEAHSAAMETEVDALWREVVGPELLGLREAISDNSLARRYLEALRVDLGSFVRSGTFRGAAMAVLATGALDLTAGTGVAVGAVTAALSLVAQSHGEHASNRRLIQRHPWFYLYQADERLQPRAE